VIVRLAGGTWSIRRDVAAALPAEDLAALLRGGVRRAERPGAGRGGVVLLDFGGRPGVGKRLIHGGMAGRILGGIYWGTRRAERLIDLARRLHLAGVPTPEVLAAGWRRVAGPLHVIALVTEAVPGAVNAQEALLGACPAAGPRAVCRASADAVRAMHDAGFVHADLNLSNLVLEEAPGGLRAHVVDLDRGRFVSRLTRQARLRNLSRLLRSHEKWVAERSPLHRRDGIAFLERYCRGDRAMARDLLDRLGRFRSRLWLRRLAWGRRGFGRDSRGLARPPQQR
jgi:tRNA A-37 threonylcarbamoyl transferase component Bud32